MVDRIRDSGKLPADEKSYKLGELEKCNRGMFTKVRDSSSGLYEILTNGIGSARGEINKAIAGKK
jgi:hypothetical protein